jgi:hypothetical protein
VNTLQPFASRHERFSNDSYLPFGKHIYMKSFAQEKTTVPLQRTTDHFNQTKILQYKMLKRTNNTRYTILANLSMLTGLAITIGKLSLFASFVIPFLSVRLLYWRRDFRSRKFPPCCWKREESNHLRKTKIYDVFLHEELEFRCSFPVCMNNHFATFLVNLRMCIYSSFFSAQK